MRSTWTDARLDILQSLWGTWTLTDIADRLGISTDAVRTMAKKLGLPTKAAGPLSQWADPEIVTQLRTLWDDGWTASQIAAKIGVHSRSSVIGKARRLGLPMRASGGKKGQGCNRVSKNPIGPRKAISEAVKAAQARRREAARAKLVENPELSIGRKSLLELDAGDCRYISGIPSGKCFCALPAIPGMPYCPDHVRIAYLGTPSNPRPRKSEISEFPEAIPEKVGA